MPETNFLDLLPKKAPPPKYVVPEGETDFLKGLKAPEPQGWTEPQEDQANAATQQMVQAKQADTSTAIEKLRDGVSGMQLTAASDWHVNLDESAAILSPIMGADVQSPLEGDGGTRIRDRIEARARSLYEQKPEMLHADVSSQAAMLHAITLSEMMDSAWVGEKGWHETAAVTGNTLLQRATNLVFRQGSDLGGGKEELAARAEASAALHELGQLSPDDWATYANYAKSIPDLLNKGDRSRPFVLSQTGKADHITELLNTALGTRDAARIFSAEHSRARRLWNRKRAGVLDNDPFKEGVLVEGEGGYTPLMLLEHKRVEDLIKPTISQTQGNLEEADILRTMIAQKMTRQEAVLATANHFQAMATSSLESLAAPPQYLSYDVPKSPEAVVASSTAKSMWESFKHTIGVFAGTGIDLVRREQEGTLLEAAGQAILGNTDLPPEMAGQVRDFGTGLSLWWKYGLATGHLMPTSPQQGPAGLNPGQAVATLPANIGLEIVKAETELAPRLGTPEAEKEHEERVTRGARFLYNVGSLNVGAALSALPEAIKDLALEGFFGLGRMMRDGVAQTIDNPEIIPLVFGANELAAKVDPLGALRDRIARPVRAATAGLRLKNVLSGLGRFSPKAVEEIQSALSSRITRAAEMGSWGEAENAMMEAIARGQALFRSYSQGAGRPDLVRSWVGAVHKLMPELMDDLGTLGAQITSAGIRKPSSLGWRHVYEAWLARRGWVPEKMTAAISRTLAAVQGDKMGQIAHALVNAPLDVDPLVAARQALATAASPDEALALSRQIASLEGSVPRQGGMARWLADIHHYLEDPTDITRAKALAGPPPLYPVDSATLKVLSDTTIRSNPTAWDRLARFVATKSGGRLFSAEHELSRFATIADHLSAFESNSWTDYTAARNMDALRRLRIDAVYRYARDKLDIRTDMARLDALLGKDLDKKVLEGLQDAQNVLRNEHRRAMAKDAEWSWGGAIAQHVNDNELALLYRDHPGLFPDPFLREDYWGQGTTTPQLQLAKEHANDVRALAEQIRKKGKGPSIGGPAAIALLGLDRRGAENAWSIKQAKQAAIRGANEMKDLAAQLEKVSSAWGAQGRPRSHESQPALGRKAMIDATNILAQSGALTPESAELIKAFLIETPDHYFKEPAIFDASRAPRTSGRGGRLYGQWDIVGGIPHIDMYSATNFETFFHEFGHHLLHRLLPIEEVQRLRRLFNATAEREAQTSTAARPLGGKPIGDRTPATPGAATFSGGRAEFFDANYESRFTEWFARSFTLQVTAKQGLRPEFQGAMAAMAKLDPKMWERMIRMGHPTTGFKEWFGRFQKGEIPFGGPAQRSNTDFLDYRTRLRSSWDNLKTRAAEGKLTANEDAIMRATYARDPEALQKIITQLKEGAFYLDKVNNDLTLATAVPGVTEDSPWGGLSQHFENTATVQKGLDRQRLRRAAADARKARWDHDFNRYINGPNRRGIQALRGALRRTAVEATVRDAADGVRSIGASLKAAHFLDPTLDLASAAALPFWEQVRGLNSMRRTVTMRMAAQADRLSDLARAYRLFSPEDRALIDAAMVGKKTVAEVVKASPKLARHLPPLHLDEAGARLYNLDTWLKHERGAQARLLEMGHDAGFLDDATYAGLKRLGYSPHIYGMHERPRLATTKRFQRASEAIEGATGGKAVSPALGVDGSELIFQRDLTKWRVHLREPDGYVYNELFDTQKDAIEWATRNFSLDPQSRTTDHTGAAYKTAAGDTLRIANPIGEDADVLDYLGGKVVKEVDKEGVERFKVVGERALPAARLEQFARLNRDLHMYAFLRTMRESGLVLSPREFEKRLVGRKDIDVSSRAEPYVALPTDRQSFGDMAGHYVHRKVLSELNNATHTYDQLRAWVEGLQHAYRQHGLSVPDELIGKFATTGLGEYEGVLARMVKTTQILYNMKAIAANFVSNLFFSHMAGVRLWDLAENIDVHFQALRDVGAPLTGPVFQRLPKQVRGRLLADSQAISGLGRGAAYQEAVAHGVIEGSLFTRGENLPLREVVLDLVGFDQANVGRMTERLNRLHTLQAQLAEGVTDKTPKAARLVDVEREIASIEEYLRGVQAGGVKKGMTRLLGFVGAKATKELGLPANRLTQFMKSLYGSIDDYFKYATFLALRKKMPAAEAAWHVKAFMQDYANVPSFVQGLGRSPLGALVPSFAYEMLRITSNGLRYKPLRFLSTTSALAAANMTHAALAGVPFERLEELEAASGKRDWIDKWKERSTSIYFFSPRGRDIESVAEVGNLLFPVWSSLGSYGAVSQFADWLIPDSRSGPWSSTIRHVIKGAGQFVGGRPGISIPYAILANKDTLTGRPIQSQDPEKRDAASWYGAAMRTIGQAVIPPGLPGGRDFTAITEAMDLPVHPDTGRPYGGMPLGQAIFRSFTGIDLRGLASYRVAKALGASGAGEGKVVADDKVLLQSLVYEAKALSQPNDNDVPIYGPDREMRLLWARWANEQDPDKKKGAYRAMTEELARHKEAYWKGAIVDMTPTEAQIAMALKGIERRGTANVFASLSPFQQAKVIVGMDYAHAAPETLKNLADLSLLTPNKVRIAQQTDPQNIERAIAEMEEWRKRGRMSPALYEYMDNLKLALAKAQLAAYKRQVKAALESGE